LFKVSLVSPPPDQSPKSITMAMVFPRVNVSIDWTNGTYPPCSTLPFVSHLYRLRASVPMYVCLRLQLLYYFPHLWSGRFRQKRYWPLWSLLPLLESFLAKCSYSRTSLTCFQHPKDLYPFIGLHSVCNDSGQDSSDFLIPEDFLSARSLMQLAFLQKFIPLSTPLQRV